MAAPKTRNFRFVREFLVPICVLEKNHEFLRVVRRKPALGGGWGGFCALATTSGERQHRRFCATGCSSIDVSECLCRCWCRYWCRRRCRFSVVDRRGRIAVVRRRGSIISGGGGVCVTTYPAPFWNTLQVRELLPAVVRFWDVRYKRVVLHNIRPVKRNRAAGHGNVRNQRPLLIHERPGNPSRAHKRNHGRRLLGTPAATLFWGRWQ